jgi:cytochrome c-type biogenesis protein CcmF
VGAALTLYAWRAPSLTRGGGFKPYSRETLLLLNNIFLVVAAASVLLGTLYPLVVDAFGLGQISVGPPYFNSVFIPVMLPFLILIGIGPYVRWKHGDPAATARLLRIAGPAALIAGVLALFMAKAEGAAFLAAGVMLAVWAGASALVEPFKRLRQRFQGRRVSLPRAVLGMSCAHLGAGCLVMGITVTSLLGVEQDQVLRPGQSAEAAGYRFTFQSVDAVQGPNYEAQQGSFTVERGGERLALMLPEKRQYSTTVTTEAAILPGLWRDLYVALGNPLGDGSWSVRLQYKPLVRFIWLGGLLMMLGGMLAASDRRYRRLAPVEDADALTVPAEGPRTRRGED